MTEDEGFAVEVTIDAPTERVWRALRDPEQLRRWHGWHFDGLDDEIKVIYLDQVTEDAEQLWLELQGSDRFTLTDAGGRTVLRLTRAPKGNNPEWDAYYEDINEGWTTFLHHLKFALERHPGKDRRTVHLADDAKVAAVRALIEPVADSAPDAPYELIAPTGERLTGTVFFRSANQIGLSVDGWGDGLLVASVHGGGMLVLTTYGRTDGEFAALEAGWRGWWDAA